MSSFVNQPPLSTKNISQETAEVLRRGVNLPALFVIPSGSSTNEYFWAAFSYYFSTIEESKHRFFVLFRKY